MMEQFIAYDLTPFDQGVLFCLAAFFSMMYHYADNYIKTKQRVLNTAENIWYACNTLASMLIGSTAWAHFYNINNAEIVAEGFGVGLMAYSKGINNFNRA